MNNESSIRQFIVTLPSNASVDKYKSNVPSNYKTHLSRGVELSDEWEVALVDIQYPLKWNNFTQRTMIVLCAKPTEKDASIVVTGDNSVAYSLPGYPKTDSTARDHWKNDINVLTKGKVIAVSVYTQKTYYNSVQQFGEHLASLINNKLARLKKADFRVTYTMDAGSEIGEFSTTADAKVAKLFFLTDNKYAMSVLGYEPTQQHGDGSVGKQYIYQYTISGREDGEPLQLAKGSLDRPFSIYVYSDIIKPQLVGDVHAPLLGVVPVFRSASITTAAAVARATNSDTLGYWSFNPPYYLPLRFHRFDTIDIVLATDEGEALKFEDEEQCKVVCRLHFQRRYGSM